MSSSRRRPAAAVALTGAISAALITTPAASAANGDDPARTVTHDRMIGPDLRHSASANWAGYAAAGGGYHSVSATWTEPGVSCRAQNTYSSFWIGLDGDGSSSVEQIGTEADCAKGSAAYSSWYEMYPGGPVNLSGAISPGDVIRASVVYNGSGRFTLNIGDQTKGWSHSVDAHLDNPALASAEVIAEAPSDATGVLPLSDFGTASFGAASANGTGLGSFNPEPITMTSGGTTKAAPSPISPSGDFTVTWHSG